MFKSVMFIASAGLTGFGLGKLAVERAIDAKKAQEHDKRLEEYPAIRERLMNARTTEEQRLASHDLCVWAHQIAGV